MAKHRGSGAGTVGTVLSIGSRLQLADRIRGFRAVHLLLPWAAIVGLAGFAGLALTFTRSLNDPSQEVARQLIAVAEHGIALMLPYGAGLAIYHGVQRVSIRPGLHSRMWGCAIALFAVTPFAAAVGISFYAWSISASDWTEARRLNDLCNPLVAISTLVVAALTVVLLAMHSERETQAIRGRRGS